VAALLVALAVPAALVVRALAGDEPRAAEALDAYLAAWSRGDDAVAARLTHRPGLALEQLRASRRGLDGATVRARVVRVSEREDAASARIRATWQVPDLGRWTYDTTVRLRRAGERWVVAFRPTAVHPRLDAATRLGTLRDVPRRGPILDRAGRPLVTDRAVVDVAVEVDRVRDAAGTASALTELVDVDGDALRRAIRAAPRGRFIPVVTLRRAAFRAVAERLAAVPGVSLAEGTAPLAPTPTFARALLGTVAPVTAEQLERLGGARRPGDEVGQFGLQAAFEERLAGTPTRAIVIRGLADGTLLDELRTVPGRRGRALRTTLDRDVQAAAEEALGDRTGNAALVAVQPSTGDVLAVANRPAASAYDRALEGRYPPGSTFKVVSTAALLRAGLDVDATVPCPPTTTVDGRAFRNFEGGAAGTVPFRVDFAQSCNTAFVGLADRLEPRALTRAARDYGLGERVALALPAASASVPPATDAVGRAAMMIGQDRILASPLAVAGMGAAVADGRWRAPRLLTSDPRRAGPALPAGEAATLRELMRDVVTAGSGTALADVPGEVRGKSGTAEYGSGDPPPTHAWFLALRGDLAVAVLVEGGRSGAEVAAPVAARFLEALDAAA
jgi:cell division protein FtsI/penicillin-binding protein 2